MILSLRDLVSIAGPWHRCAGCSGMGTGNPRADFLKYTHRKEKIREWYYLRVSQYP